MHRSDAVVTLAEVMKRQLVERGVPTEKITVIPNAVDVDAFRPVPRDMGLAMQLGLAPDEAVLGYVSSFAPYEGITYLIEALAILRDRGHRVRALLVGDGDERSRLEQKAAELGVADHVIFTGRVPHVQVLQYYSLIDLFIVPRTADRVSQLVTPLKPYEAMATARLVVVSRVEALREMVVEGSTGLAFEPENAADLARVVEPFLFDAEARMRMGASARQWVVAHRTWKQNGQTYRALYDSLVRLRTGDLIA